MKIRGLSPLQLQRVNAGLCIFDGNPAKGRYCASCDERERAIKRAHRRGLVLTGRCVDCAKKRGDSPVLTRCWACNERVRVYRKVAA